MNDYSSSDSSNYVELVVLTFKLPKIIFSYNKDQNTLKRHEYNYFLTKKSSCTDIEQINLKLLTMH